jgi:Arc/MetJ family transcription regulator
MANVKRTSMFLDRDLVHAAEVTLGTKGPTETVHAAMREVVQFEKRRAAQKRLLELIKRGELVDPEYAENFWRYRHPDHPEDE